MNSQEWRKIKDDLTADIATKEARLAALASEKARAITDQKKLVLIEEEEMKLPALIEVLRKRSPVLEDALEGALKTEAEARQRELEQQVREAADRISTSTRSIRLAMQELLNQISAAHVDLDADALSRTEGEYLRIRFALSPLQVPAGDCVSIEERARFMNTYERLLRHTPSAQPWAGMLGDWQVAQRRKESQRVVDEEQRLTKNDPLARAHRERNENLQRLADARQLAEESARESYNQKIDERNSPEPPRLPAIRSY